MTKPKRNDELTKEELAKLFADLVAEAEKNMYGYIDFEGKNCEEPCGGWDGDHRCECGNRRVCWVLSDCGTYVYAEAY